MYIQHHRSCQSFPKDLFQYYTTTSILWVLHMFAYTLYCYFLNFNFTLSDVCTKVPHYGFHFLLFFFLLMTNANIFTYAYWLFSHSFLCNICIVLNSSLDICIADIFFQSGMLIDLMKFNLSIFYLMIRPYLINFYLLQIIKVFSVIS